MRSAVVRRRPITSSPAIPGVAADEHPGATERLAQPGPEHARPRVVLEDVVGDRCVVGEMRGVREVQRPEVQVVERKGVVDQRPVPDEPERAEDAEGHEPGHDQHRAAPGDRHHHDAHGQDRERHRHRELDAEERAAATPARPSGSGWIPPSSSRATATRRNVAERTSFVAWPGCTPTMPGSPSTTAHAVTHRRAEAAPPADAVRGEQRQRCEDEVERQRQQVAVEREERHGVVHLAVRREERLGRVAEVGEDRELPLLHERAANTPWYQEGCHPRSSRGRARRRCG